MKKEMLNEVQRIQELMSVNKKLLLEQPVPVPAPLIKKVFKYGDNLLDDLVKFLKNEDEAVDIAQKIEKAANEGKSLGDDFYEALAKKGTTYDIMSLLKSKKLLGNLDAVDQEFFKKTDELLAKNDLTTEVLDDYTKIYRKSLDEYKILDPTTGKMENPLTDEAKDELTKIFRNDLSSKYPNVFSKSLRQELDNIMRGTGEILNNINPNEVINTRNPWWRKYVGKNLTWFNTYISNVYKSQDKLKKRCDELLTTIKIKLESKPQQNIDKDAKEFLQMVQLLRKNFKDASVAQKYQEQFINSPILNSTQKTTVRQIWEKNPILKDFLEHKGQIAEDDYSKEMIKMIGGKIEGIPGFGGIGKKIANLDAEIKGTWNWFFTDFRKGLNYVFWGDTRSMMELSRQLSVYGRQRMIASYVGSLLISNFIVLPLMGAVGDKIVRSARKAKQDWRGATLEIETLKYLCDEFKKKNIKTSIDCDVVNEIDPNSEFRWTKEEFLNDYKSNLGLWGPSFENPEHGYMGLSDTWAVLVKDVLFFTKLDEFGNFLYQSIINLAWDAWESADDMVKNYINKLKESEKQELLKYGIDVNKPLSEQKEQIEKALKESIDKTKTQVTDNVDDAIKSITDWSKEAKEKGLKVTFNLWGQTQNPKLTYVKDDIEEGIATGAVVASDNKKYSPTITGFEEF